MLDENIYNNILNLKPSKLFIIGTVTKTNPFEVKLDGDIISIPAVKTSNSMFIEIGDRVILLKYGKQFLCLEVIKETLKKDMMIEHGNEWHSENFVTLGESSTTAYRGDRGKIAYNYSQIGHLPLTGGTITGALNIRGDITTNRKIHFLHQVGDDSTIWGIDSPDRSYLRIAGGGSAVSDGGGFISLYGKEDSSNPGNIILGGGGSSILRILTDGSSRFYGDLRVDGVIKIPHAVGGPATFQVSGSSGRQIAYLRADGTTNTDIRLYGPQDNSSQSQINLRTAGSNALIIYSDQRARFYGDVRVDGAFTNPSSKKLKTNIKPASITDCYEHIKGLKFRTYNLKSEIEKLPEEVSNFLGLMVEESPEIIKGKDGESINIINYISLIGAALQETQSRLEKLENKINNIKGV